MSNRIQVKPREHVLALVFAALATTAVSAHAGKTQTDPLTGQVWQIFDNVSDGLAQGYRRATVDDFKQLLVNSHWLQREGSPSVYDLGNGGGTTFINGVYTFNIPNIDFGQSRPAAIMDDPHFRLATAAWLQDSNDTNAIGMVETWAYGGALCGSGRSGCNQYYAYRSSAEIATADDLVNKFGPGKYPSYIKDGYLPVYIDPLSSYRQLDNTIEAGTFMITSVPEPASAALLSLGLMGGVAVARVRRAQQANRQD